MGSKGQSHMAKTDGRPLANWECRRLAMILASQLPPDRAEAMLVLGVLHDIVVDYWDNPGDGEGHPPLRRGLSVVGGSPEGVGASPSLRAHSSDSPPLTPK